MKQDWEIDYDQLKQYVDYALEKLYQKDMSLIDRKASERDIVFRFGLYMNEILQSTEFCVYDIDVEYNRNGNEPKRLPNHKNGTYPDFIIHKREVNTDNLLVLEFKTEWYNNQKADKDKIQKYMDLSGEYKFKYGATILINKDRPQIEWFEHTLL